jgi:hypothetical protein
VASADDDHAHDAQLATSGGQLDGDADAGQALPSPGGKKRRDGSGRRREADVAESVVDADPEAVAWAQAFLAAREADGVAVSRQHLLGAAHEAGLDTARIRRALDSLGIQLRRNRVGRPKRAGRRARSAGVLDPGASRPERQSRRVPNGRVRIVSVDVETAEQPVGPLQPLSIIVRIRCDGPGRLEARVLVRGAGHGEVEAIVPARDVTEPGTYGFSFEVPPRALGELKHSVDVEAWLRTETETFASMQVAAQRFRSRERGGRRPFVRLDAVWSENAL